RAASRGFARDRAARRLVRRRSHRRNRGRPRGAALALPAAHGFDGFRHGGALLAHARPLRRGARGSDERSRRRSLRRCGRRRGRAALTLSGLGSAKRWFAERTLHVDAEREAKASVEALKAFPSSPIAQLVLQRLGLWLRDEVAQREAADRLGRISADAVRSAE